MQKLLKKGEDPNSLDSNGHTPLYLSILTNNKEGIQILLDYKAKLMYSEIPIKTLNKAAIDNDTEGIKILLF